MGQKYIKKNIATNEKSEKFFLERGIRSRYYRITPSENWCFRTKKNLEKVRECVSPLLSFRQKIGCG